MKKPIVYLASNLTLISALYASIRWEIDWLQILVVIFVWTMLVFYAAAFADAETRKRYAAARDPYPRLLGTAIDAVILVLMLNAGWYLTATAYVTSAAILVAVYGRFHLFRWTSKESKPGH